MLPQANAYAMACPRAAADIATNLDNHSFRATGITAYFKNGGTLERPRQWRTKSTGVEPGRVLFLYTPGRAGKMFEEVLYRPIGSLSQQEGGQRRERHGTAIVGPPPF